MNEIELKEAIERQKRLDAELRERVGAYRQETETWARKINAARLLSPSQEVQLHLA